MTPEGTWFQGFLALLTIATVAVVFTKTSGFLAWMPLHLDGVITVSTNNELAVREISWREKPYETAAKYLLGILMMMLSALAAIWIWCQVSSVSQPPVASFVGRSMLWLLAYIVIVPLFLCGASEALFTQTLVATTGSVVWRLAFAGFVVRTGLSLMSSGDSVSVFRRSDTKLAHYWVELKRPGRAQTIAGCRNPEVATQFARRLAQAVGCPLIDKTITAG